MLGDKSFNDMSELVATATENYTRESGILKMEDVHDAELAKKFLLKGYDLVKIKPLQREDNYDLSYHIEYDDKKELEEFTTLDMDESMQSAHILEAMKKRRDPLDFVFMPKGDPTGTPIGNGNGLGESVEKHDDLNDKLFDGEELKSEVKEKLLEIAEKFVDNLKQNGIDLKVEDVQLVGSNASYNYTDKSDIDLHIIADLSVYENKEDLAQKLYDAYRQLWNNKYDPTIYGHEVELYVEPKEAIDEAYSDERNDKIEYACVDVDGNVMDMFSYEDEAIDYLNSNEEAVEVILRVNGEDADSVAIKETLYEKRGAIMNESLNEKEVYKLAKEVANYYDEYSEINEASFDGSVFKLEILCDDGIHRCAIRVPEDVADDLNSIADYIKEEAIDQLVNESMDESLTLTPAEEADIKASRERRAQSALLRDIKKNGTDLYGNSYDRFGVIPGEEVDRYYHSMYHDDYGKLTDVREIPYNEFKKYVNPEIYTPEQGERLANFVKEYDDKVKQYTDLNKTKLAKEAENDRKYWQDYLDTWTAKRDLARKVEAEPTGQMSLFDESKKIKRYGDQTKLFGKHSGEISESFFANNYDKGELEEIIHVLILNFGPVDVYKGTDEVYVTIYDATEDEVNACLADGFDNYRVKQVAARANDRGIARTFMFYFEDEDYVRDFNMSHDTDRATQNWW